MEGFGIRLGLLEEAVMVSVWVDSLAGPGLRPERLTVCRPAFSRMLRLVRVAKVGGSLTERTVTVKELVSESTPPLLVPPLSWTTTVMVAVPNWLAKGAKVNEPDAAGLV